MASVMSEEAVLPLLHEPTKTSRTCGSVFEAFWNSGYACLAAVPVLLFICNATASALTRSLPVMEVLLLRSVLSVVLVFFCQTMQKGRPQFSLGSKAKLVVLHTTTAIVANILGFIAISLLPLADALTLFYSSIAITAFFGWLLRIDNLRLFGFAGVALCMAGIVFVVQPTFLFPDSETEVKNRDFGVALAIGNGVMVAATLLLKRAIGRAQRPDVLCLYNTTLMIPVALVSLLASLPESPEYKVKLWHWGLLVLNASGGLGASVFMNRGTALVSSTLGAISCSLQMLFAPAADVFLMHGALSVYVLSGALLMLSGSTATILSVHRE